MQIKVKQNLDKIRINLEFADFNILAYANIFNSYWRSIKI